MRFMFLVASLLWAHPAFAQDASGVGTTDVGETVDVEALVRRARSSPQVRLADADVAMAEAAVAGAAPLLPSNPQISLSLGRRNPPGGLELQAQLQQTLNVAGQRHARRRAAQVGVQSAEQARQWSHRTAEQEVRRWAYRAMVERERLGIAARVRALAEEIRRVARLRVETGEASPVDVLLAETEVARARGSEIAAALREQQARAELARLVDWPRPQVPVVTGEFPELREPPPMRQLVAKALQSSALLPLRTAVRAARAGIEAADRGAIPNPTVGAYYGREGDTQPAHVWMLTLGVPLPFWQRNQRAREAARATLLRRERELEVAERTVRTRVAQLRAEVAAAYQTARVYETSGLQSVQESLARTQRAFELGEISLLAVTQVRQRALSAMSAWMEARLTFYDAAARLAAFVAAPTVEE